VVLVVCVGGGLVEGDAIGGGAESSRFVALTELSSSSSSRCALLSYPSSSSWPESRLFQHEATPQMRQMYIFSVVPQAWHWESVSLRPEWS